MITVDDALASVVLEQPRQYGNLTVFPLLSKASADIADYVLLDDALASGMATVTEIGETGTVPELHFSSTSPKPVLLLDGEELIGAKQNRVINLTILAPAHQSIVIPVSCVEAGRWRYRSARFRSSGSVMYSRARAAKNRQVSDSLMTHKQRRSDQAAVWADIADKAARMQSVSATQAMSAVYEKTATLLDEYVRALDCPPAARGALFAVGGSFFGLDLFDDPATMRFAYPKLLRSYALDAMEGTGEPKPASEEEVKKFLANAAQATTSIHPAVGLGEDLRIEGESISGAGLWALDRFIHLCAFSA